jgi:nucleotide-binding universal stress UspA family protein
MQEEEARLEVAKIEFSETFKSYAGNVDWRSATVLEPLADYVAREARCANLLMTHVQSDASSNPHRLTNTGDLVLKAGRPVLVVAANADALRLDHSMIAWKDTREARRAVLDALPLLSKTRRVTVVELAAISELAEAKVSVNDVCHWLNEQGVTTEAMVVQSSGNDVQTLDSVADSLGVGIVIAGAYGHSRLREWVFGGFTSTLLQPSTRCSFLSH